MMLAIIFDSVGVGEWLILLAVVLVVVGPKRLPATARTIGRHYAKFRRAADSFKRQLLEMDSEMNRAIEDAAREVETAANDIVEPVASDIGASAEGDIDEHAEGDIAETAAEPAAESVAESAAEAAPEEPERYGD